jgi:hypothetical protein
MFSYVDSVGRQELSCRMSGEDHFDVDCIAEDNYKGIKCSNCGGEHEGRSLECQNQGSGIAEDGA